MKRHAQPDRVVARCLTDIRTCRLDAAGVLADRLEESGHPLAHRYRKYFEKYEEARDWAQRNDWSNPRNSWTRWEAVASWDLWMRDRTAKLFGRNWKAIELLRLHRLNGE
jgi:hypothetical protein